MSLHTFFRLGLYTRSGFQLWVVATLGIARQSSTASSEAKAGSETKSGRSPRQAADASPHGRTLMLRGLRDLVRSYLRTSHGARLLSMSRKITLAARLRPDAARGNGARN